MENKLSHQWRDNCKKNLERRDLMRKRSQNDAICADLIQGLREC